MFPISDNKTSKKPKHDIQLSREKQNKFYIGKISILVPHKNDNKISKPLSNKDLINRH